MDQKNKEQFLGQIQMAVRMLELARCSGPQFDPRIVEAFQASHPNFL